MRLDESVAVRSCSRPVLRIRRVRAEFVESGPATVERQPESGVESRTSEVGVRKVREDIIDNLVNERVTNDRLLDMREDHATRWSSTRMSLDGVLSLGR